MRAQRHAPCWVCSGRGWLRAPAAATSRLSPVRVRGCGLWALQDFADQYGDMSDQPATLLAALEGDWSFVLFDTASSYLLAAQVRCLE
jgi:hypothetical protein